MKKITNMHNWISELPLEIQQIVLSKCKTVSLDEGESLWHPSDRSDACYRISRGRLKVCNVNSSGQEMIHAYLVEADCIGEWGILIDETRMNHVYAIAPTELLMLSRSDFLSLYDRFVEVPRALSLVFARRMRHFMMLAEDASLLPLNQRLARTILRLGHADGKLAPDGTTVIDNISQEELSRSVGATRQSVSRELRRLKNNGEIEIKYGRLIIFDITEMGRRYDSLASETVFPDYQQP